MALFLRQTSRLLQSSPRHTFSKAPPLSSILLQLPPSCRSFHASPRQQNFIPPTIVEGAVEGTHFLLQSIHSVSGLPWIYTLPLSALMIRLCLFPITLTTRRNLLKQISLTPLLLAWKHTLQKTTFRRFGHLGPNKTHAALLRAFKAKRVELYERHGCQLRKNYLSLIQLPIFLTVMETMRKMSGAREGLLGMMMSSEPIAAAQDDVDAVLTSDALIGSSITIPLEPSFATEGALWFPDLLLPDPTLALPCILSVSLLLSLYGHKQAFLPKSRWVIFLRRSLTLGSLAIPFVLANIPCSLLVYWISSVLIGWCQNLSMDWWMPIKSSVKPPEPKRKWRSGLGVEAVEREEKERNF